MKYLMLAGMAAIVAGCGIDGAPIAPKYTLTQTFAINSRTGPKSKTALHVDLTQKAGGDAQAPESEY